MIKPIGLMLLSALLLTGQSLAAPGQKKTPSHVYQTVSSIAVELDLLHDANLSKPKSGSTQYKNRRPRHVYQKAREVLIKVNTLRWLNGVSRVDIPNPPAREIVPGDVNVMVAASLQAVRGLRSVFGVAEKSKPALLVMGKTPSDVYANLARVSVMVDGLGIPSIVPNDVYRLMQTVLNEFASIQRRNNSLADVSATPKSKGRSPKDVYVKGLELLTALKELVATRKRYQIAGGVKLIAQPSGNVSPGNVLDLIGNILAEVSAMKAHLGIKEAMVFAAPPSGKTPSDVYDSLQQAIVITQKLP